MALKLDGLGVLRAITAAPEAFPAIQADLAKAASTLVTKQLKAAKLDVPALRSVRSALGAETFAMVVEGLKDTEIKTITGRLDKHLAELKTASATERRRHLLALADDREPTEKPRRATTPKAPASKASVPRSSAPRRATRPVSDQAPTPGLDSAAMSAVPPRRRRAQSAD